MHIMKYYLAIKNKDLWVWKDIQNKIHMPLYLQKEREMINRMLKEIFAYIGMEEKKRTKEKKRLFWVCLYI